MVAKFAPESDASAHDYADHGGAIRDFFNDDAIVESHLAEAQAMRAIRADVPHAEPVTAFCGGECQL